MASVTSEEVDSHLSCAICLGEFKEPKVLACLHTYCKECLMKLTITQGAVITCPECRQDIKIVDGDVNKLQTNFWVNNFLTLRNAQLSTSSGRPLICEHCDSDDPAVSRCTECCVFMCEFCVTAHKRINATKDHQILSLEEVGKLGSMALKKPALCTKHSEETLKLFCQTCQKAICRDCIIVDHRDHTYDFVSEVADKERKIIQNVLRETKTKERSVNDGLKAVQSMENCVRSKAAEINEEVDTFFDSQVKELENLWANLKNEVTRQEQGKLVQLRSQSERLSSFQVQLKSGIDFCDQAIADGDAMALLSVKKQVIQRLSQLNASQYDCQPCENEYLKLQVRKTIRDIGKMAVLHHAPIDPDKCILSLVGGETGVLYQTLAGQTVDFLLTLPVNHKGATEIVGSYAVSAIVKYQKQGLRETQEESLPVCDNGDGSHSFSFRPRDAGQATLSVIVEGQDIHGSPFVWQVKDKESGFKVQGKKMKLSPSAASQDTTVVLEGMQCWKLKLVSFNGMGNPLEIGVKTSTSLGHKPVFGGLSLSFEKRGKWSWQYEPLTQRSSRSDDQEPSITSVQNSDVFTVFLNHESKKLMIYNVRSKQCEVFTDVEGELVPLYSPDHTGLFDLYGNTNYLTHNF